MVGTLQPHTQLTNSNTHVLIWKNKLFGELGTILNYEKGFVIKQI